MIKLVKYLVIACAICLPASLLAQKDSVWLKCPLDEAIIVPPPKNVIKFDEPDLCIGLVSVPDTIVKACITGRVSNVIQNEDEKWEVVFYYRDYYFWYSGLTKVIVKKNDNLKLGQPLGFIAPGDKLELSLYKFETPLDPTHYLDCKTVIKTN
ncbi:MAG TPA: hypothetical protein VFV31_09380 [Chitinophagaceae bacterium]|nr:hypothetical protein [Chitinophagaceae bacterium]